MNFVHLVHSLILIKILRLSPDKMACSFVVSYRKTCRYYGSGVKASAIDPDQTAKEQSEQRLQC